MLLWRFACAWVGLLGLSAVACQTQAPSSGEQPAAAAPKVVQLAGVDTSKMTEREREQWSALVGELLAPCPDQPVSLAQCVAEKRACEACLPAANFLTSQVTRGKSKSQAEAAFRARFAPDQVKEIDIGDSPATGAKEPSVTIVEWADFECPFCGVAQPILHQAVARHPQDVRLVYKNYPLSMHQNAEGAARAGVAALIQGKFWEIHSLFFQNQETLDDPSLERFAKQAGLDVAQFNSDRKSEAVADRVATDRKQGDSFGLKGTPTIYINGRSFDLEKFDLQEDLEAWIELEISLKSGSAKGSSTAQANGSARDGHDQPVVLEKPNSKPAASTAATAPTPAKTEHVAGAASAKGG
ncbi:MAG TPA: thioredoxin domain-containing protein [Polyangiaceae bacterium]|nr:thioredoxin domain-containing protein [Polyangiaceae bacterium]